MESGVLFIAEHDHRGRSTLAPFTSVSVDLMRVAVLGLTVRF